MMFQSSKLKTRTSLFTETWKKTCSSSKIKRLSGLKRGKRDVRALSFELSKMTPQVGLAVLLYIIFPGTDKTGTSLSFG